jgi:flagellar protein FliO/FliZ
MDVIEPLQFLRLIAALVFVVALMGALALAAKKLGLAERLPNTRSRKRLSIVESLPIDSRRRLLLVQCDNTQHLVLCGINGDTIIQTNIEPQNHDATKDIAHTPAA